MKTTHFESLYVLDPDVLEASIEEALVMRSTQNWEHYFFVDSQKAHIETLLDVTLLEFDSIDNFQKFINTNQIIDYSMEHENPMVLIHGKK